MLKRAAGVIRRIYEDAFHLAGKLLLQRLEREEVVAEDEAIIKKIVLRNAMLGVVGFGVVGDEDARLQPRPVLFPNPS